MREASCTACYVRAPPTRGLRRVRADFEERMANVVIYGATSAIAQAVARRMAARGDALVVVGRDQKRTESVAKDLVVRGAKEAHALVIDFADKSTHDDAWQKVQSALEGPIDTVLIAHGLLGDQRRAERESAHALEILDVNFLQVVTLLLPIVNTMEQNKTGTIGVISSVAGDRGRQSNYVYGTAKGAVNVLLEGLAHRLAPAGVRVVNIKPGFVDTPMTASVKKGPLFAKPDAVAKSIVRALDRQKPVVYVPWFWWGIMTIIRALPRFVFNKLRL
jgi:decaprenylphospho-beta-D-erythro-pentofuranosid-2-ulose 2-reductase